MRSGYTLINSHPHLLSHVVACRVGAIVTSPPRYMKGEEGQEVEWEEMSYAPIAVDLQDGSGIYAPQVTIPAMKCALGREPNVTAYIGHMILCMRDWREVLHETGTLWIHLNDTPASATPRQPRAKKGQITLRAKMGEAHTKESLDGKNQLGVVERLILAAQAEGFIFRRNHIQASAVSFCPSYTGERLSTGMRDAVNIGYSNVLMFSVNPRYHFNAKGAKEPLQAMSKKRISAVWTTILPEQLAYIMVGLASAPRICSTCNTPALEKWQCKCAEQEEMPFVIADPFNGAGVVGSEALKAGCHYIGLDADKESLERTRYRLEMRPTPVEVQGRTGVFVQESFDWAEAQ